jgi:carbon monoxide dehydrogenase subunit G
MLEQRESIVIEAPLDIVWRYVGDMGNWASNMPGYRSFEMINDRESLWILKIGFGALVRTVKVRVHIDLWREPDHVTFSFILDDDPVDGGGAYVARGGSEGGTEVDLALSVNGKGKMAPAWEAMGRPILPKLLRGFSRTLKAKIEELATP